MADDTLLGTISEVFERQLRQEGGHQRAYDFATFLVRELAEAGWVIGQATPTRWALPDQPGPGVKKLYGHDGTEWHRGGYTWSGYRHGGLIETVYNNWRTFFVNEGPLTLHPPGEVGHG